MNCTNWKFGGVNINALVLGIAYVSPPPVQDLPKCGEERILYHIYRVCGELGYLAGDVIKVNSLVKYGLDFIADTLLNPFRTKIINVFDIISYT